MIHAVDFVFLAAGMGGFVVCIISDFVGLRAKRIVATALFVIGMGITAVVTNIGLMVYADLLAGFREAPILKGMAAAGAVFFVVLTIYSLVCVPKENYNTSVGQLTDTGLYGLCRHPGLWCFGGAYLFMGLMADHPIIWAMGALNVIMDLIYVTIQDLYIFPKTIAGYDQYKTAVPFLIPNGKSIRRALGR